MPGTILLSGPSKSGKTHTLFELADLLRDRGTEHLLVRHGDADARSRIERAEPSQVLLFDGIERASGEILRALNQKAAEGISCVCTLSTDREAQTYHDVLLQLALDPQPEAASLVQVRSFRISPLARDDARRIALLEQETPFDSVMVAAVTELSWGRPGWLIDLLHLAESGKIRIDPHPRLTGVDIGDLHLPVFHEASRAAESALTPSSIAAAIVLSELDQRTINGASDLVGARDISALQEAGLLVECPQDAGMVGVPEVYAAALRLHADPERVREAQHAAAERLLAQEALGIPLPDREAAYCAWVFDPQRAVGHAPHSPGSPASRAHARLVGKVVSELVWFGHPETRDLLLRVPGPESFGEFSRVQAATILSGPAEGLRVLHTLSDDASRSLADETTLAVEAPPREYVIEFLRHQLLTQADVGHGAASRPHSRFDQARRSTTGTRGTVTRDLDRAALVFRRWNDVAPLEADAAEVLAASRTHPVPEVALLAEQLLVLESIRRGLQFGDPVSAIPSARLPSAEESESSLRCERISALALDSRSEFQDLLTSAAVAEGLIALLSATNLSDSDALQRTAQHFPGTAFHELWVQHLTTAMISLAAGNTARAAQEWTGLESRLPRFLPARLQRIVATIGQELRDPTKTPDEFREPTHQLLDYFRGALDTVRIPPHLATSQFARDIGTSPLPVFCLAEAHLDALETQNPVALMRAAEGLQEHNLWAPSAYALQAARTIFLRRRASGSVSRCNERLRDLESVARRHAPWFSTASLASTPRSRLTRREVDVAMLGAAGLSNREIAERLDCSVRTIESHLASARAKLGAAERSQLSERMRELGYL